MRSAPSPYSFFHVRVSRRRREDFDVVPQAQLLGKQAARVLGTGADLAAVARCNQRESSRDRPLGATFRLDPIDDRS
jgi:hypothetical protein